MRPSVVLLTFPVIFLGELPDKTMFASLMLATKGKPHLVWLGAAAAFTVHVVIATTVGVALFAVLPHRAVEAIVAVLFLGGAIYAWREDAEDEAALVAEERSRHGVVLRAFLVIFIAEWGDLTQILTANLAAKYHSPLSVGVGSTLALWSVAALAVTGGATLLRYAPVMTVRRLTVAILIVLALYSAWAAVTG